MYQPNTLKQILILTFLITTNRNVVIKKTSSFNDEIIELKYYLYVFKLNTHIFIFMMNTTIKSVLLVSRAIKNSTNFIIFA